ncbi:hypothetical protein VitviT2T_022829 [Vitis vinifera]|uniref:Uncharacterized protein n=1 Tax=Vitis vinifera TaxID=29760 RepID=A0ABY9DBU2_VITVI|nr:hypothetical protein VitviT2T_022829 [Vitis vinifera]
MISLRQMPCLYMALSITRQRIIPLVMLFSQVLTMLVVSGKAGELKEYSVELLHAEGVKFEGHGQIQEALAAYINALLLDPGYVPCKILIGALLLKMGSKAFPAVRSLLSDALRIEPTNRMAWYYLGMAHRDDGRIADATDCFQAASILEESNPLIPPWSHACTYPVAWPPLVT